MKHGLKINVLSGQNLKMMEEDDAEEEGDEEAEEERDEEEDAD